MRTVKVFNNLLFSSGGLVVNTLLNFAFRTVFIYMLGVEYLGLSAVYANIMMILSLGELGVSQAISYSLYKPLNEKNIEKIKSLLGFYKKIYFYIGMSIILFGIILMPFISFFINEPNNLKNIYSIYLLFLCNSSLAYFWGYKRTLIIADQKNYKLIPFTIGFQIISVSLRIVLLVFSGSYLLVLFIQLIIKFAENFAINKYIDKYYPYILTLFIPLLHTDIVVIKKNVKAMIFHKFGDVVVNGTDNIIISMFLGIGLLGLYSNYIMLISILFSLLMVLFNATTASFGNMIADESRSKLLETFNAFNFLGFWIFGWASITFYFLALPFVTLWLGNDFHISETIIALLAVNLFMVGIRVPLGIVKSAAGIYSQDKYAPIIQGVINLVVSMLLVQYFGIVGVLAGTLISSILVPNWYRPFIVYKHLFDCSCRKYFYKLGQLILVLTLALIVLKVIFLLFISTFENVFISFAVAFLICLIIPNIIVYICYSHTSEMSKLKMYFKQAVKKGLHARFS